MIVKAEGAFMLQGNLVHGSLDCPLLSRSIDCPLCGFSGGQHRNVREYMRSLIRSARRLARESSLAAV